MRSSRAGCEHGRLRRRQGRALASRRDALDATRDQARETLRLRTVEDRQRWSCPDLRASRQPGLL
ncbi:MAG: hypothetical protein EBQ75_08985, partial [Actinobacteria bacterium]|nr:hypothetical protein [Actinomycetota bacterium]